MTLNVSPHTSTSLSERVLMHGTRYPVVLLVDVSVHLPAELKPYIPCGALKKYKEYFAAKENFANTVRCNAFLSIVIYI